MISKVIKSIIYCFAIVFLFTSCTEEEPLPVCVEVLLEDFKLEACAGSADLTTWEFNGREVYCFFYGNCVTDNRADIYEADCTLICSLFGLSGNIECEGIEWDGNAIKLSTIYQH